MSGLTAKQQTFVEEYLIDLNGKQAAIRAGYSPKTAEVQASRLLSNAKVTEYVQELQGARSERTEITQDYVLESIYSTVERCKQTEPVTDRTGAAVMVENSEGDIVPAYTFNAMGVFKGTELLGKHLGMFIDRTDHTSSDGSMSPAQSQDAVLAAMERKHNDAE